MDAGAPVPERSPSTRPFMPGLHQPVGVAVVHLTNGFPGSFCQALGAALPGPRWGGRGLEGARSTGFLRTPGTSTGPFHPHCPLHFSGGPNVSRCTKCCLYYFVRNDFSVNQALMKISATKIKFYILREAIWGTFLGWIYAGIPRQLDADLYCSPSRGFL